MKPLPEAPLVDGLAAGDETAFAAEIPRNAKGQRRQSVPDRGNAPSRPTDAGFDAVRRTPQGLGTPEIRLPKRPSLVES